MIIGHVHNIRVNPEDEMACIDVCKISNVYIQGMSLAQVVRLALSGLLESARAAELIPRRDGFEYNDMVSPLINTGRNGKKLQISETIKLAEVSRTNNDLPSSVVKIPIQRIVANGSGSTPRDIFIRRHGERMDEINWKIDNDAENVTQEERDELYKLVEQLNSV